MEWTGMIMYGVTVVICGCVLANFMLHCWREEKRRQKLIEEIKKRR